jgi:hypothetical protein
MMPPPQYFSPLTCCVCVQVALRVYRRSQRTSTSPPLLLGKPRLQNRLLEARGWRVVGFMLEDWDRMEYLYERIEYLECRLRAIRPRSPPSAVSCLIAWPATGG